MNVVKLQRYRSRETIGVLEALAARAAAGEIIGVALSFRRPDGTEEALITGSYADNLDAAAAATLRLSMKLASGRKEYDSSP